MTDETKPKFTLETLEAIIAARGSDADAASSWTAKLIAGGQNKAAQKLGEEATEAVIAAVTGDREGLIGESADLIYHWLVVLKIAGISTAEIMAELERRTSQSGLKEKASR